MLAFKIQTELPTGYWMLTWKGLYRARLHRRRSMHLPEPVALWTRRAQTFQSEKMGWEPCEDPHPARSALTLTQLHNCDHERERCDRQLHGFICCQIEYTSFGRQD